MRSKLSIILWLVLSSFCFAQPLALQSTAYNLRAFIVDSTDHTTGKTGLTLTITAAKSGTNTFSSISPTVTEIGSGWYNIALTTSHTDTLGEMAIHATGTAAEPYDAKIIIVAVNLGSATAFITGVNGLAPPTGWNTSVAQTGDSYARIGALGAGLTAVGDTAGITTLLSRLSSARAGYIDNINNAALQTTTAQTGDSYARIGATGSGLTSLAQASVWTSTRGGYVDNLSTAPATAVWAAGTRTLTAGTNIVLAKGTGVTGFNDITAASVWAVSTRALTDKANFTLSFGEYTNIWNNNTAEVHGTVGTGSTETDIVLDDANDDSYGGILGYEYVVTPGSNSSEHGRVIAVSGVSGIDDTRTITISPALSTAPTVGHTIRFFLPSGEGATPEEVWTNPDRTLTSGTNIVLAKGTGITGFSDIAATDVWAAGTRSLTDKANFSLSSGAYSTIASGYPVDPRVTNLVARTGSTTSNIVIDDADGLYGNLFGYQFSISPQNTYTSYGRVTAVGPIIGDQRTITISPALADTPGVGNAIHFYIPDGYTPTEVWANGTRTLTAGTNIALAKGTGVTGFNDITTANVRTELGTELGHINHLGTALELDGSVYRFTTNALEQAPTGGGGGSAPTAVENAAAVWAAATRSLTDKNNFSLSTSAYNVLWSLDPRMVTAVVGPGSSTTDIVINDPDSVFSGITGYEYLIAPNSTSTDHGRVVSVGPVNSDLRVVTVSPALSQSPTDGAEIKFFLPSGITESNVWANSTRTLTSGSGIALAKGIGVTGFNDITANGVWSATPRTLTSGGGGGGGASGGGILHAKIADASLDPENKFLAIIQGEEKTITFIVEADGRFDNDSADAISVKFKDSKKHVVTIGNADVSRIAEESDIQVFRITLSPEQTAELADGLITIEIAFDEQKAILTHSMKIVESL